MIITLWRWKIHSLYCNSIIPRVIYGMIFNFTGYLMQHGRCLSAKDKIRSIQIQSGFLHALDTTKSMVNMSAISAFWKTHNCKLIPNWTRKTERFLNNNININTKVFALVLHLNCNALSRSESSNFVTYIINTPIIQHSNAKLFIIRNHDSWIDSAWKSSFYVVMLQKKISINLIFIFCMGQYSEALIT